MKLNCGKSLEDRAADKANWHCWFAWYPVRVGKTECRWLETVQRRAIFYRHVRGIKDWEYKPLDNSGTDY